MRAVFMLLILLGALMSSTTMADEPKTDPAVSAADLRRAFDANVMAAERAYTGRPLRVAGRAGPVRKTAKGGYFFDLEQLPCFLSKEGEAAAVDLLPGQAVVVTGTLSVTPLGAQCNLEMKDCTAEVAPGVKAEAEEPKKDAPKANPLDPGVPANYTKVTVRKLNGATFLRPVPDVPGLLSKVGGKDVIYTMPSTDNAMAPKGSEITEADGTVWVVEKSRVLVQYHINYVKLKPKDK